MGRVYTRNFASYYQPQYLQPWPQWSGWPVMHVNTLNVFGTPGTYQISAATASAAAPMQRQGVASGHGPSRRTANRAMRTERGQKLEAQLVSADEAAIEQLMSLGNFGRWEVIEALLAVDRNVEQAALHLTGEPMAHLGECGFVRDRPLAGA